MAEGRVGVLARAFVCSAMGEGVAALAARPRSVILPRSGDTARGVLVRERARRWWWEGLKLVVVRRRGGEHGCGRVGVIGAWGRDGASEILQ
jgi:hypothetical protein